MNSKITDTEMVVGYLIWKSILGINDYDIDFGPMLLPFRVTSHPQQWMVEGNAEDTHRVFIFRHDLRKDIEFTFNKKYAATPEKWAEWLTSPGNKGVRDILSEVAPDNEVHPCGAGVSLAMVGKARSNSAINVFIGDIDEWEITMSTITFAKSAAWWIREIIQKHYTNGKRTDGSSNPIWYSMSATISVTESFDGMMNLSLQSVINHNPIMFFVPSEPDCMENALYDSISYMIKAHHSNNDWTSLYAMYNAMTTNLQYASEDSNVGNIVANAALKHIEHVTGISTAPKWLVKCWASISSVWTVALGPIELCGYGEPSQDGSVIIKPCVVDQAPMFNDIAKGNEIV